MGQITAIDAGMACTIWLANINSDIYLLAFHMGSNRRLIISLDWLALFCNGDAANRDDQPVSVNQRADLPTAITIRPQFASSPAMAVFTSGELATLSAMARHLAHQRHVIQKF